MNALEMAEAMEGRAKVRRKITNRENTGDRLSDQLDQAAAMLRQQQAEIEAFKQIIDANNLSQNIGQFVKPTNEPVAWMHQNPDYAISKHQSLEFNIPLYIHPVKEQDTDCQYCKQGCIRCDARKQLTDEEIKFIAYPFERAYTTYDKQTDTDTVHTRFDQLGFAKAILRKAQENENKP